MTINNPMQMLQFIKKAKNPQQFVCNMIEERMGENPLFANLLNLAKNNKGQEIEQIARNMCKEQGIDFDKEFNNFKQNLGL
jgi:hypothetical protein